MSNIPKLDSRDFNKLLNEVKFLAKQYTPEWNFDENSSDFGVVLAKVFCSMMESTISRYNKTSYNYYLTFLNLLGTKLRSAASARGMIIIKAVDGSDGAYIDKGATVFADADTEDGMVIYETLDAVSAVDAVIKKIYFTDAKSDFIGCVYSLNEEEDNSIKPFRIFDTVFNENLQCHELYFGDDTIFDMSKTNITFSFHNSISQKAQKLLPHVFSDPENTVWEYYDKDKWIAVDSMEKTENGVNIKFNGTTQPSEVMGNTYRFIRCRFKHIPDADVSVTSISYQSHSDVLKPTSFFSDESELAKNDFFPFGEQYTMYSTFSFKCDEAFTKKGANIEISADIQFIKVKIDAKAPGRKYKFIMSDMDFAELEPDDIQIEKVKWEYWNGSGWAKLTLDTVGEDFFKVNDKKETKRTLKFKCPQDIESISVGSADGYFIRARISKIRDQFDFYANYITPYIHDIEVKYDYENQEHPIDEVLVRSDLKDYRVKIPETGLVKLIDKSICDYPAMYININKPLNKGMIRIFIDIEEGVHRFNPTLKWEYLADDNKCGYVWKHIEVMDGTDNFSHSEIVTLIGKSDFKEATMFGNKGYFIRIINPDCKYSKTDDIAKRPIINDIKFNATRVIQRNTREPEYFSIAQDEKNRLCKLSYSNVSDVSVWIDELGKISTNEQESFLKMSRDYVRPEYNELGVLENLWIKWNPVPNLVACDINDRVYEVNYPKGEILFGNGKHGKIPPPQYNESIKIHYSICNGSKGNIKAHEIKDFVNAIPNVESVDNPTPIMGGVDMENIDSAARRMFGEISGGNRLVSLSDFEDLIRSNDRNIYKIKCMCHVDEDSKPALGVTSIAVLPREFMQGYEKFQGIKDGIFRFMKEKAPANLTSSTKLRIFEVAYVETSVHVEVVIDDFNSYQGVYKNIESKLKKFLDPINGNFSGKGWNIGEFPRKEFIYNYIKTVPNLKWIKSINLFTKLVTADGKREIDIENIKHKNFIVPVFGNPDINITVDREVR